MPRLPAGRSGGRRGGPDAQFARSFTPALLSYLSVAERLDSLARGGNGAGHHGNRCGFQFDEVLWRFPVAHCLHAREWRQLSQVAGPAPMWRGECPRSVRRGDATSALRRSESRCERTGILQAVRPRGRRNRYGDGRDGDTSEPFRMPPTSRPRIVATSGSKAPDGVAGRRRKAAMCCSLRLSVMYGRTAARRTMPMGR